VAINNMTGSLATRTSVLVVVAAIVSFISFFSSASANAQEIPSGTTEIGRFCPNPAGCESWEVIVLPPAPQNVHLVLGVGGIAATDTDPAVIGELGLRVRLAEWANWQVLGNAGIDDDLEFVGGLNTSFNFKIFKNLTLGPAFRWSADTGGPVPSPETHSFTFGPRVEWAPKEWTTIGVEGGPSYANGAIGNSPWGGGASLTWRVYL
jgi:hypothetical protein